MDTLEYTITVGHLDKSTGMWGMLPGGRRFVANAASTNELTPAVC